MRTDNKEPIKVTSDVLLRIGYILDSSGSMRGEKYDTAVQTLKSEVDTLLKSGINYAFTINEFSNDSNFIIKDEKRESYIRVGLDKIKGIYGGTALYDAIGETVNYLRAIKKEGETVLISILTDGQEMHSYRFTRAQINTLIKETEKEGFTFNFIGTQFDSDQVEKDLGLRRSNMTTHNNDAQSIMFASNMRTSATMSYSKKIIEGEAVLDSFFTGN